MSGVLTTMGLRKPKDPLEDVKKWRRDLAKEMRSMDREIKKMEAAEKKSAEECRKLGKNLSKRNRAHPGRQRQCAVATMCDAKATRVGVPGMYQGKAQLNSISMQLQTQASMAGCMKRSTAVMGAMNKVVKLPELQKTMLEMAREMERAGLIEETVNDALEMGDSAEVEEETEIEINSVVAELTSDLFTEKAATEEENVGEEEPGDLDAMKARLQAL